MLYSNKINFQAAKVLVIGDIILDRYWYGPTNRISREAPIPVVVIKNSESRPGGAANVAMNIVSLNAHAKLISLAGKDKAAETLRQILQQNKIDCQFVELEDYMTTDKLRILSRNQQLIRLDFEEDYYTLNCDQLLDVQQQNMQQDFKVVIFSDYGGGTLNNVSEMIKIAKQHNIKTLVDPKGNDFSKYYGATLLTPNLAEFETVVGYCANEEMLVSKGQKLIKELALEALLITRSEKGMTLLKTDGSVYNLPAKAKEVYDVTGAGDTVIAVLASVLATGASFEESCYMANIAASIVVGKLGCATVTPIEIENAIRGRSDVGFGIMDEDKLLNEVNKAKQIGEKIVMTNGCFDILHPGHISYLENARKLGDRLIVAVNSDESVKSLKGEQRPINNLDFRMTLLAALGCVDWVVPFSESTPQRLIGKILPDVLVKGGDYQIEQIPGHKEVFANGGDVQILNFEEGFSTTKIIEKIKNQ